MTGTGLPVISRRKAGCSSDTAEMSTSAAMSVNTGMAPWMRGISRSCIGTAATADTRMVTTNSEGCISPTCRFPMRRMARTMSKYKISVRHRGTSTAFSPFLLWMYAPFAPDRRSFPRRRKKYVILLPDPFTFPGNLV